MNENFMNTNEKIIKAKIALAIILVVAIVATLTVTISMVVYDINNPTIVDDTIIVTEVYDEGNIICGKNANGNEVWLPDGAVQLTNDPDIKSGDIIKCEVKYITFRTSKRTISEISKVYEIIHND